MKTKHKFVLVESSNGIIHRNKVKHEAPMQISEYFDNEYWTNEHLYILSDEEIKEGDWVYTTAYTENGQLSDLCISKVIGFESDRMMNINNFSYSVNKDCYKKVIATNDPSLNLPIIDNKSIQWYCYNPCDEVIVEFIPSKVYSKDEDFGIVHVFDHNNPTHVILHPIKTTWKREEVEKLCESAYSTGSHEDGWGFEDWLKENLYN